MANITRIAGGILLAVGLGGYLATDGAHVTALLPAVLGLAILALGIVAGRIEAGQHAIHAALVVALLGALASLQPLGGLPDGEPAAITSLITVLVCVIYLGLGVRSFVAARRSRAGTG
jgi:hypothetical protein